MSVTRSIRGMPDLLPGDTELWRHVEGLLANLLASYGYSEIRFPLLEKTELFSRTIGEVTDIVEKEMYCFLDRNEESLTLRPEGTAGCVRAVIQNSLINQHAQKLWYCGPMFRYERPQKGRQRQFHQIGLECFGYSGPDVDAEVIALTAEIWKILGIDSAISLELNSLGSAASRAEHRQALVGYFSTQIDVLDEDSLRRLHTNPLRILDSKNPDMQALIEAAPQLADYLDSESREHFDGLCGLLDGLGISYRINPRLVRGLDYYSRTVFEWVTEALGAQGTVCGGGRYDSLVQQLGGPDTPALGFGMGLERLMMLIREINPGLAADNQVAAYIVCDPAFAGLAMGLAQQLRAALPGQAVIANLGGGSFKSQFKKADRSDAKCAIVVAAQEAASGQFTLKYLRQEREQESLPLEQIIERLRS